MLVSLVFYGVVVSSLVWGGEEKCFYSSLQEGSPEHTWIRCRIELYNNMAVCPNLLDITALRIMSVDDSAVPSTGAFMQDIHVEAVQVDRMSR